MEENAECRFSSEQALEIVAVRREHAGAGLYGEGAGVGHPFSQSQKPSPECEQVLARVLQRHLLNSLEEMMEVAPDHAGFQSPLPAFESRGMSADFCSSLKQNLTSADAKVSDSLVQEGCPVISLPKRVLFFLC